MFDNFNEIKVGDKKSIIRYITEEDINKFADFTGDYNPLHINTEYAKSTEFKGIVAHGMLSASFLSTLIGTKLPGHGALWLSQNLEFVAPVRVGDELNIICRVLKKNIRERILELETIIKNQYQKIVLRGEAKVKVLNIKNMFDSAAAIIETPKVVIVTGGSGGIGSEICRQLAKSGFTVVVNFINNIEKAQIVVNEIKALGGNAISIRADVTNENDVKKMIDATVDEFGTISALINNASSSINPKKIDELEWKDFQNQMDTQLRGAFLLVQKCIPVMSKNKFGRIINITSQVIDGFPTKYWTAYAVSKGALSMFSKYMAAELGPMGINVNCVSPGLCETDLTSQLSEKSMAVAASQTSLRRLATPKEIASVVESLLSNNFDFVTGEVVSVNGGRVVFN